jgi:hypothetical protein
MYGRWVLSHLAMSDNANIITTNQVLQWRWFYTRPPGNKLFPRLHGSFSLKISPADKRAS